MAELISRVEGGCTYSASKITLNEFSKKLDIIIRKIIK